MGPSTKIGDVNAVSSGGDGTTSTKKPSDLPSSPTTTATSPSSSRTSPLAATSNDKSKDDEVEIKKSDLAADKLDIAISLTKEGYSKSGEEVQIAEFIKRGMDEHFGPKWHCVVGRHFASHVSYAPNNYVYLKIGREVVLLYKSGGTPDN